MSRIAKRPVELPAGVEVSLAGQAVTIKGPKGSLEHRIHDQVEMKQDGTVLTVAARSASKGARALAGTTQALLSNMVVGVSQGFEKKLELVGVGYRAQMQGRTLNLTLGFSHPVNYEPPAGVTIETPSQTEVVVKGSDKQRVGQVSAEIRAFRPPEPYKGKGVKYADEHIMRKEAKKK
ncbi:MAG: 50S ribosomal protein L6 [Thiotrichales bacterium SG8_50]|jgi:large subunit ribosomal protein L6|nr:MAG: 50S ribosomal protein L6 [Thiotrichales bacterium SG8_50]